MKKLTLLCLAATLSMAIGCKKSTGENENETTPTENAPETTGQYILVKDSTKVSFTAYKTTDKLPVKGTFKEIGVTNTKNADTPLEVLNGAEFKIPVSSIFTNDATNTRDAKIVKFFFGAMKNTEAITGTFKVEGENCSIDVTLNGETANIPLEKEMTADNKYTFKGVMNLENWKALDAVASINKACEALHTGADGVSKTWSEVAVEASVVFEKK